MSSGRSGSKGGGRRGRGYGGRGNRGRRGRKDNDAALGRLLGASPTDRGAVDKLLEFVSGL